MGRAGQLVGVRRALGIGVASALAMGGAWALAAAPTGAAGIGCAPGPLTVNTNADTGAGSLRAVLTTASGVASAQTICIDTTLVTAPIVLGSDLPTLSSGTGALTITGNGATVNGNGHRVINDLSSALLTVNGLTITGGQDAIGGTGGGAINSTGGVTVTNSTITNNTVTAAGGLGGGGINAVGAVTVTNSTIANNTVSTGDGSGGGVHATGNVTVTNSTISGNTSGDGGGGIETAGSVRTPSVTVTNSTISANTGGQGAGGGIDSTFVTAVNSTIVNNNQIGIEVLGVPGGTGTLTLVYSTVTGNTSPGGGAANLAGAGILGGLPDTLTSFGSVVAQPQIVSGQLGTPTNCNKTFTTTTSHGFNFTDDTSCGLPAAETHAGVSPQLGGLANNGGSTQTLLPQSGSPLIDAIPNGNCGDGNTLAGFGITADQRALARPSPTGGACDIGAVEVQAAVPVLVTPRFTG